MRATLSEYGIPVDHRASVYATVERPDNSQITLGLVEIEPGIFEASTRTSLGDEQLCQLLECLLGPNALGRFLGQHNIEPNAVRSCIERWCKQRLAGPSKEELQQREGTLTLPVTDARGVGGQLQVSDVAALLADMLSGAQPIRGGLTEPPKAPPVPPRKPKP